MRQSQAANQGDIATGNNGGEAKLIPVDCKHNTDCRNPEDRKLIPDGMVQVPDCSDPNKRMYMWVPKSAAADALMAPCPAPQVNLLAGVGVSGATPTGGAELSGGIFVNSHTGDTGLFVSPGASAGWNVGADAFLGIVTGDSSNVFGQTINENYSVGPISVTTMRDPKTGDLIGGTAGLGVSATFLGYSGAYDSTHGGVVIEGKK